MLQFLHIVFSFGNISTEIFAGIHIREYPFWILTDMDTYIITVVMQFLSPELDVILSLYSLT